MEQTADALVDRFKKDVNVQFTPAEAAILTANADRDLLAAKAAALYYFKARDLPRALALSKEIATLEPTGLQCRGPVSRHGGFHRMHRLAECQQKAYRPHSFSRSSLLKPRLSR